MRSTNPCVLGSAELYHPYPGDETRYIQCSQWGESNIKSCGVGQVWNNGLKTCHKQTSGPQQPSQNQIYTTGPSGYQMTDNQYNYDQVNYDYHYNYGNNNNGQNRYQNQEEPQYYIDANNNVGTMYSPGYSGPNYQNTQRYTKSIQNDLPREYNTGSWSSDTPTYQQSHYAIGNSLWNTFASALHTSQQNSQPQTNRLSGQSMFGTTNHQQSGKLYGRTTSRTSVNNGFQPAEGNSLWNNYASYLMGNSNSFRGSRPVQANTYNRIPSMTRSAHNTVSNTAYLVDRNKVNTGLATTQPAGQTYTSKVNTVQHRNAMVHAQKQAPAETDKVSITQPVSGFDVPELCRDADIRYISAQNDYHHFYECVKGSAQINTCPDGKVWVHPLRQCIDLNDYNDKVASHNPCIGSDLRFHPYPADPSKYVECQSWYRVYVWRCKDGLWTQNKQQCSTGTHHGTGTGNSHSAHIIQYFHGQCDGKTFYYAHENPAKYIQCDDFGNWFLKDCALNTTWDDSLKGCVQSFSSTGPAEATVNTVTSTANTKDGTSRQLPDNFDGTLQSYPCPATYAWNITRNECVPVSLSDYLPTCARGYMWDSYRKECIMYVDPSTVEEFPDAEYARPNCMAGHRWNQELQMCVQDTIGTQVNTGDYGNFLFEVDLGAMDVPDNRNKRGMESGDDLDYLPNICNTSSGRFYYPYPSKPHLFIQCDQLGVMHTQTCGAHSVWNNDILTCVHSLSSVQLGDSRQYTGSYQGNNDNVPTQNKIHGDVCKDSDTVYYPYSANKRMFIMCYNGMAHMMSCPYGSYWQDSITTCNWPEKGNN